ncbi:MAG TPA: DUF5683 domain-containing protein [Candidatus Xenobia bacterium]
MPKWIPAGLTAVLLTFVWPGLGQLYNRQWLKAAILGGTFTLTFLVCGGRIMQVFNVMMDGLMTTPDPTVLQDQVVGAMTNVGPSLLLLLGILVATLIDAFRDSRKRAQETRSA